MDKAVTAIADCVAGRSKFANVSSAISAHRPQEFFSAYSRQSCGLRFTASKHACRRSWFSTPVTPGSTTSMGPVTGYAAKGEAAGVGFEHDDAEGVGQAGEDEHIRAGVVAGEVFAELVAGPGHAMSSGGGDCFSCLALTGPPSTTALVPGRSSFRNTSMFFSTATRPPNPRSCGFARPEPRA